VLLTVPEPSCDTGPHHALLYSLPYSGTPGRVSPEESLKVGAGPGPRTRAQAQALPQINCSLSPGTSPSPPRSFLG
jgi:hypothetical protein